MKYRCFCWLAVYADIILKAVCDFFSAAGKDMKGIMLADFEQIRFLIKNKTYEYIGSGSGRMVYDLGNGYVVKVAKNKKGFAQNQAEYRISVLAHSSVFAKIHAVSNDFKFLIMDKADKVKDMAVVWKYFKVKSNLQLFQLEKLRDIHSKYNLLEQDLYRPANWGLVRGRPVIVDYGYTMSVKRHYYR